MPQPSLPDFHNAKPFVKWVGGKRSLLPELLQRVPSRFNNYYEPFVGGGALFFALKNEGRIKMAGGGGQAFLSDINFDLINTYHVIQREVEPLIERLREHAAKHCKDYYYEIRSQHNLDDRVEIAARFIYLNKTCYNGLWRVNSQVASLTCRLAATRIRRFVKKTCYAPATSLCRAWIFACVISANWTLAQGTWSTFDPPYRPLDKSSFTRYAKDDFRATEQEALRNLCLGLDDKGANFMLSNSDTSSTLYDSPVFNVEIVKAPRFVNSRGDRRGPVTELLITNF